MNRNLYSVSLIEKIAQKIAITEIGNLPQNIYAKIDEIKGNVAAVIPFTIEAEPALRIFSVPIMRTPYNYFPIKKGDVGILVGVHKSFMSKFSNNELNPSATNTVVNGTAYLFLPLAPSQTDYSDNVEALSLFSQDGKTSIKMTNETIEVKDKDNNILKVSEEGISLTDTNENKIILNSDGISITDKNNNSIKLENNGTTITDKNNNKIVMGSSGITLNDNFTVSK